MHVFQCPLEIDSGTLHLQGEYQTMLGQGAILQQRPTSGRVYLGITVVPADSNTGRSICSMASNADLLTSFEQRGDNRDAAIDVTDETLFRKNITLRVRPRRSGVTVSLCPMCVCWGVHLYIHKEHV